MNADELRAKLAVMCEEYCNDPCEFANGWCAAVEELCNWLLEVE